MNDIFIKERNILGIDPGTDRVGYCVAKIGYEKGVVVDYGVIEPKAGSTVGEKLLKIYTKLTEILIYYRPFVVGVESVYFFKNHKTVIAVSEARGVIVLAASQHKVPIIDVTPLEVKIAVCGYGRAEKQQIEKMVMRLFCLEKPLRPDDISDAAAIAWATGCKLSSRLRQSKT